MSPLALNDLLRSIESIETAIWVLVVLVAISTVIDVLHFMFGHRRRFD